RLGGGQDVVGFDESVAGGGGDGQSVVGEGVDSAHDSLGSVEEGLDGGFGGQRSVDTGELESVLEVEAGGVAVAAAQGGGDGDSVGEGHEAREAESLAQSGVAGQGARERVMAAPISR